METAHWQLGIGRLWRFPLRSEGSQPHALAWGPSTGKRSPHNFWLWRPAGIVAKGIMAEWEAGLLESQTFLVNRPSKDLPCWPLTGSNSSAGAAVRGILGRTELSGFRAKAGKATFSQTKMLAEAIVPLLSPPPPSCRCRQALYLSLNRPG